MSEEEQSDRERLARIITDATHRWDSRVAPSDSGCDEIADAILEAGFVRLPFFARRLLQAQKEKERIRRDMDGEFAGWHLHPQTKQALLKVLTIIDKEEKDNE